MVPDPEIGLPGIAADHQYLRQRGGFLSRIPAVPDAGDPELQRQIQQGGRERQAGYCPYPQTMEDWHALSNNISFLISCSGLANAS